MLCQCLKVLGRCDAVRMLAPVLLACPPCMPHCVATHLWLGQSAVSSCLLCCQLLCAEQVLYSNLIPLFSSSFHFCISCVLAVLIAGYLSKTLL
mmetsp:Transcript_35707/g.93070  ORF Transcript_35707/g.93070 Transcript_35707/m.93070 type:complete len:94 (-) Transcript_35707:58-339(-)